MGKEKKRAKLWAFIIAFVFIGIPCSLFFLLSTGMMPGNLTMKEIVGVSVFFDIVAAIIAFAIFLYLIEKGTITSAPPRG